MLMIWIDGLPGWLLILVVFAVLLFIVVLCQLIIRKIGE